MRIPTILLTTTLATVVHATHLSAQEAVSVTDSAGVRIVESSAPAWPVGAGWRVGTEPILTIGEVSGDLDYVLEWVSHALRLEDGTIVVADRGPKQLRLFGADGVFIRNLGRSGEGPGEFAMLSEVWARGDTILASDSFQGRVSVFGRGGEVLETIRVELAQGRGGHRSPHTQFADGAILVLNPPTGGVRLGGGDVIPGAVWRLDRYSRAGLSRANDMSAFRSTQCVRFS
ncbi:MAG: 6-bladed beta-propeller, partial [Gemmatimonadota bacterium]|nr:6-bladed beta-propeller [Gemmatimonadota bacterium]